MFNPELLLALCLALGRPLRLNMTSCADCQNGAVVPALQQAEQRLVGLLPEEGLGAELVFDSLTLDFEERSCSRREFFSLLNKRSKRAGICIAERLQAENRLAYASKQLPAARQLLLQVRDQLPEAQQQAIKQLFPQRLASNHCRYCTGCVGICPTGALLPPEKPAAPPGFNAENCISCRLCEALCANSGAQIIAAKQIFPN